MTFTPTMAEVNADLIVAVAESELMDELPQGKHDRIRREESEHKAWLTNYEKSPKAERTPQQQQALSSIHFPSSFERHDLDDIGVDRHHNFYHPPSALHEPFASRFALKPEAALRLVKDLANQAVAGWRQIHGLNPKELGVIRPAILTP